MKKPLRQWWDNQPDMFRKTLAFISGIGLVILSPFIGWIPGPGGIIVFLAGIGILASEFDWAESLKAIIMEKVPNEVKK